MATTTLIFVIIGVSVASVNLMKLVEWLACAAPRKENGAAG